MAKILITNWRKGLEVISLTRVLVHKYGLSLKEARTAVIEFVDKRKEISIELNSNADISDVENDMNKLDITYKIVD